MHFTLYMKYYEQYRLFYIQSNFVNHLGYLKTNTLGRDSKPLNYQRNRILCSLYTQIWSKRITNLIQKDNHCDLVHVWQL
jgi:hypothetical protein